MNNNTIYFADYQESTLDPGWSLVAGSSIACILLHLLLPCIVSLGSRYERNRIESTGSSTSEDSLSGSGRVLHRDEIRRKNVEIQSALSDRSLKQQSRFVKKHHVPQNDTRNVLAVVKEDEQSSATTGFKNPTRKNSVTSEDVENANNEGLLGWFCGIADVFFLPQCDIGTSSSTSRRAYSATQSNGTKNSRSSKGDSSTFGGRPGRQPGLKRNTSYIHESHCFQKASERETWTGSNKKKRQTTDASSQDHSCSRHGSVMSRLHYDDVSFSEAVDSYGPTQYLLPCETKAGEVDIFFGEHAWWKPAMISGAFDRIVGVAEYDKEFSTILKSAIPYSLQAMGAGIFNLLDVALVSNCYGGKNASAFIVVPLLTWVTNTMNYGFCEALGKTVPSALSRGENRLSGSYFNASLCLYTIGMFPTAILWSFLTQKTFIWLGFDEETALIAQTYAYTQILLEWVTGIEYCIHSFLDMIGHEKYSTYAMFVQNIGQTIAVVLPILAGKKDLLWVGCLKVALSGIIMFINTCIILYKGWVESFSAGFLTVPFSNLDDVKMIGSLSGLLGVSYFLTYGQWELFALFARALGPAEIVTWGLLGHIWSTMKFVSDGIADAAEVRCALHLVTNHPELARLSAYKSLFLGFVSSVFVTSILFMLGEQITFWLTPDATLQRLMLEVFPLIGIGHIVMTSGVISWALLGAQGRYNLATLIHFIGTWGVTFPLSCVFTFALRIDLQGLASAVVLGLAISGAGNLYVLVRTGWEQLADSICREDLDCSEISVNEKAIVPMVEPSRAYNTIKRNVSKFDALPRQPNAVLQDDSSVSMESVGASTF